MKVYAVQTKDLVSVLASLRPARITSMLALHEGDSFLSLRCKDAYRGQVLRFTTQAPTFRCILHQSTRPNVSQASMKTANTCTLFTLLLFQTFSTSFCQATKYTAATDYGFGPLYIGLDVEGDKLTRCENLNIALGGGFGPYRLGKRAPS